MAPNYDGSMSEHGGVLVVGAGLAGLNAALTLHAGVQRVLVLEGRVDTDQGTIGADRMIVAGDHRETPSQQGAMLSGRRAAGATLRSLR